jgi:hypothetical protein
MGEGERGDTTGKQNEGGRGIRRLDPPSFETRISTTSRESNS